MAAGWIIKRNNKESGPFSAQQLKKLAETGKLKPADLIRKEPGGKFQKANAVKGLFPEESPEENAGGDSEEFANVDISRYGDLPMDDEEDGDDNGGSPKGRRSKSGTKSPPRGGGKGKGKGKGKSRKKDKEFLLENDPVNDLFWGMTLVGIAASTLFYMDPEEYELPQLVVTIHEYSGRFGVAAFMLLVSLVFFVPAFKKIQRLKAKGKSIPWHIPALGGLLAGILSSSDSEE